MEIALSLLLRMACVALAVCLGDIIVPPPASLPSSFLLLKAGIGAVVIGPIATSLYIGEGRRMACATGFAMGSSFFFSTFLSAALLCPQ